MFKYIHDTFYPDFYRGFYYSILFVAVIISLIHFRHVGKAFKWISLLLIITLISDLIASYVYFAFRYPKNIIYHFFTPIEYFIYASAYVAFLNNKKWNRILMISVAVFVGVEILNTLFLQPLKKFPSNIFIVEDLLLVYLSLILFSRMRSMKLSNNLLKEGIFWFNSSVLFYCSLDILISGLLNLVISPQRVPGFILNILLLFNGLLYACFAISIILNANFSRKTPKIA